MLEAVKTEEFTLEACLAGLPVSMDDVLAAREVIAQHLAPTPLVSNPVLSELLGCQAHVKLENSQAIGSFKIRGGLALMAKMSERDRKAGLVTATRGNHGQSLAQAARLHGVPCTIFVPEGNNPDKNAAMQALGAHLVVSGHDFDAAWDAAERFASETGATCVHPAREPALIAGVATAAMEMLEQAGTPLDAIFVPVGGGSIAAGTALVVKALSPNTQVIGVQAENAPAFHHAWHTGEDRPFVTTESLADGLAVRVPVDFTLSIMRPLVDDMLLVSEDEICTAIRTYASTIHQMAEGAGAAPLAGAMQVRNRFAGKQVGLMLTGGNISPETLARVIAGEAPAFAPQAMPMYPIDTLEYGYR